MPRRAQPEDDPSDSISDAQRASDEDGDSDPLETRVYKEQRQRTSAHDVQQAGKPYRARDHQQGQLRQVIHPGSDGSRLDWEPLPLCSSSHREGRRIRSERLGDNDTASEGCEEEETDSLDSFIENDSSADDGDDDGDYTPTESADDENSLPTGCDAGEVDDEIQQPQSHTPVVLLDTSSDAGVESVSEADSDSQVHPVPHGGHKHVVTESSDDESQLGMLGPATPAQEVKKVAGCKRLCKRN